MANQTYTITMPDLHQGPVFFWPVVLPPTDGARMLVDANGSPQNPVSSQWTANIKSNAINFGQAFWDGTNIQICSTPGTAGSGAEPTWSTLPYPTGPQSTALTTDGTAVFTNVGPPYSLGGTDDKAEASVSFSSKVEDVMIDQETAMVDAILVSQAASFSITLKESLLRKVWYGMPGALFSTGTDSGLPSGVQAYEQLDFGGMELPNLLAPTVGLPCALITPRRGFQNRYIVACLYNAVPKAAFKIGVGRDKQSLWKLELDGMAQPWRTRGKRVGQIYRQL
jgi:hypothetical protein